MRVGFFQIAIDFADRSRNLDRVTAALSDTTRGFDLLVLPELLTTGYLLESRAQARSLGENIPEGPTSSALIEIARGYRAHLVGGLMETDGDHVYNTAVIVGPEGFVSRDRKASSDTTRVS